jgi:hypothetical protein
MRFSALKVTATSIVALFFYALPPVSSICAAAAVADTLTAEQQSMG